MLFKAQAQSLDLRILEESRKLGGDGEIIQAQIQPFERLRPLH